jgi:hypothetical protein
MPNLDKQPEGDKMAGATLIEDSEANTGYRFSWGLAIVGGASATAITFFLLTLGSGLGLMLVKPLSSATPSVSGFLTGGAIYFFVAQAFGFAVGGHLAGRLLGPIVETDTQETFRAVAHGLLAWCVAVLSTLAMLGLVGASAAGSGATIAALYTFQAPKSDAAGPSAYVVDVLFRPEVGTTDRVAGDIALLDDARGEAGRILALALSRPAPMQKDDLDRLSALTAKAAGVSLDTARARVLATETNVRAEAAAAAEKMRRVARDASLWLAASLLFGALVSMTSAVFARIEDDRESLAGTFYGRAVRPKTAA